MSHREQRYHHPIVHHSRESSRDSQTSYDSRSSEDPRYSSSRSSMGYYGGSQSKSDYERSGSERKYRVPDDDRHHVTGKTHRNSDGREVEVIHQRKPRYVVEEPRSSQATPKEYKETKDRSHKHRSHRHDH